MAICLMTKPSVKLPFRKIESLFQKDSNFFDSFLIKGAPPQILLLRFGNISNKDLIVLFGAQLSLLDKMFKEDKTGPVEFFPDRLVQF